MSNVIQSSITENPNHLLYFGSSLFFWKILVSFFRSININNMRYLHRICNMVLGIYIETLYVLRHWLLAFLYLFFSSPCLSSWITNFLQLILSSFRTYMVYVWYICVQTNTYEYCNISLIFIALYVLYSCCSCQYRMRFIRIYKH